MLKRKLITIAVIVMTMAALTGCGKEKIDVMESVTVLFDGYDGFGTATLENESAWENKAFEIAGIESIDGLGTFAEALVIEGAVSWEITPNDNLSNGDEVTVKAVIDSSVLENYDFELVADSELKIKVENLPELTTVNLFENIDVAFSGVAPEGTATLIDANSDYYVGVKRYTLDKTSDLNIGDKVTVTAEYDEDKMLKAGYIAEEYTKEFVVPDIDRYAMGMEEISDDALQQLKKQTEGIIEADVANRNKRIAIWSSSSVYSLENKEFLGNYFLAAKDAKSAYRKNYCYFVYRLDMAGNENFSCYYTVAYYDILTLEDGTCSYDFDKRIESNPIISKGIATYAGYDNLDQLYNDCVTQNLADYTYESTVNE